jgi:hypothetical protein
MPEAQLAYRADDAFIDVRILTDHDRLWTSVTALGVAAKRENIQWLGAYEGAAFQTPTRPLSQARNAPKIQNLSILNHK